MRHARLILGFAMLTLPAIFLSSCDGASFLDARGKGKSQSATNLTAQNSSEDTQVGSLPLTATKEERIAIANAPAVDPQLLGASRNQTSAIEDVSVRRRSASPISLPATSDDDLQCSSSSSTDAQCRSRQEGSSCTTDLSEVGSCVFTSATRCACVFDRSRNLSEVRSLRASLNNDDTLRVEWDHDFVNLGGFRLAVSEGTSAPSEGCTSSNFRTLSVSDVGNRTSWEFRPVDNDIRYTVRVCAVSTSGNLVTVGRLFTTATPSAPANVTDLFATSIDPNTLQIQWNHSGDGIAGYRMAVSKQHTDQWGTVSFPNQDECSGANDREIPSTTIRRNREYRLQNLLMDTPYRITVCAVSSGRRLVSRGTTLNVRTARADAPQEVQNLRVDRLEKDVIRLAWDHDGVNLSDFVVKWDEASQPLDSACSGKGNTLQTGTRKTAEFTGLTVNTSYRFMVCVRSKFGNPTNPGAVIEVKTKKPDLAPAPISLEAKVSDVVTLDLAWQSGGGTTVSYVVSLNEGNDAALNCSSGTTRKFDFSAPQSTGTPVTWKITYRDGLIPNHDYTVRVCALNLTSDGDVTSGPAASFRTKTIPHFDESFYVKANAGVAEAIGGGQFRSGADHYLQVGIKSQATRIAPWFDGAHYNSLYPSLASQLGTDAGKYESLFLHYVFVGSTKSMNPSPLFDETLYLALNPDVASMISSGAAKTALDHFVTKGIQERRKASSLFDETYYLANQGDVASAVTNGILSSGFEHFVIYGQSEGRRGVDSRELSPVYRAHNKTADYHFFTRSMVEHYVAIANGYTAEGVPFMVAEQSNSTPNLQPLLRLYNPNNGRHYYTLNSAERDSLVALGYRDEGSEGFMVANQVAGTEMLFRLYNRNSGAHLFTLNALEAAAITTQFPGIWEAHTPVGFAWPLSR